MSWDLHITRIRRGGRFTGPPAAMGRPSSIQKEIKRYFPEAVVGDQGRIECDTNDGQITFLCFGSPVTSIAVEAHPVNNRLALAISAMAQDNDWVVIDNGTGDTIDIGKRKVAKAANKLPHQEQHDRLQDSAKPMQKVRLPRITAKSPLTEADLVAGLVSMAVLRDDETTDNVFDEIPKLMFPDGDEHVDWYPMSANEEVLVPDGRRLSLLHVGPYDKRKCEDLLREYYRLTDRVVAKITRGTVTLSDRTRFRASECIYARRVHGTAKRVAK